jgi:hypothetical protein
MSSFWKSLVGVPLDTVVDLKDADQITYSYLKKIEMVSPFVLRYVCGEGCLIFKNAIFVFKIIGNSEVKIITSVLKWVNSY